jgi:hypothetical protein
MKAILTALILVIFLSSCKKNDNNKTKANAEIIGFNSEKCMCCWGWNVKMGNDTIKIDRIPSDIQIGYEISKPIPVYIELGSKKYDCSSLRRYEYYEIKKIEIIK